MVSDPFILSTVSLCLSLSLPLYLYLSSPTPPCGSLLEAFDFHSETYLGREQLHRLTTPRVTADHRSAPPTPNDLGTFISAIQGELQYVKGDPILWSAVTRGVVKAVQLFTTKVCFRVKLECIK